VGQTIPEQVIVWKKYLQCSVISFVMPANELVEERRKKDPRVSRSRRQSGLVPYLLQAPVGLAASNYFLYFFTRYFKLTDDK
jgi:hypothetical protein